MGNISHQVMTVSMIFKSNTPAIAGVRVIRAAITRNTVLSDDCLKPIGIKAYANI